MRNGIFRLAFAALIVISGRLSFAQDNGRFLVLNFDCHGDAIGKSAQIGDSLRYYLKAGGVGIVSDDLLMKLVKRDGYNAIDLNYIVDDLRAVMGQLNADAAIYGHILSSYDLLTLELRMIEKSGSAPILFDPIICGTVRDFYGIMPEIAGLILAPDKSLPLVLLARPRNNETDVGQYVDMTISFSKPMNPATYSITGFPENMWTRYGEIDYDEKTYTFTFRIHLYPEIDYEFHVNGAERKGFKDAGGNVAPEYVWKFSTGKW